ncbi:MAG: nuclear transport factor 2 family protein [Gemmatimonadota bacterium]
MKAKLLPVATAVAIMSLMSSVRLAAQSAADSAAIRATALDYVEGWYTADSGRMARAVHPDLVKRIVQTGPDGRSRIDQMDAARLVANTGRGGGKGTSLERQQKDVVILDIFQNAASVRATMSGWIDYLQLARFNGRWVIINVLWEMKPRN